jgi:hypothetical protein
MKVTISPRFAARVFRLLVLAASCLTLVSFVGQSYIYSPKDWGLRGALSLLDSNGDGLQVLNVEAEASVPAWFSSALLLLCSLLALNTRATGGNHAACHAGRWKVLALLLLLMSMDEEVGLHERLTDPLRSALSAGGPFYYAWVIPGVIFVLAFALAYRGFLLDLPRETRGLFAVAGILYVCGALILEMAGGSYADSYGVDAIAYLMMTSFEEYLEMVGLCTLLYALMLYTGSSSARTGTAEPPGVS